MKKRIIPGIFLVLILLSAGMLRAQTPGGESSPVSIERARRSDDLGQSSAATAVLPEVKTYEALRRAISRARAQSRTRVEKAVEQERVREAWEIGRLIDAHVLQYKERADYGKQVLLRLSKDLGMSDTELGYMLQFARAYPISRPVEKLSWSHYEILLAVNDPKKRQAVAERAEKEGWSRRRLREEVNALKRTGSPAAGGVSVPLEEISLPPSQPGKPGTYRVVLATAGPYAGELAIDLGFSNYISLSFVMSSPNVFVGDPVLDSRFRGNDKTSKQSRADDTFKEGDIVASSQDSKGHYSLQSVSSPHPPPVRQSALDGSVLRRRGEASGSTSRQARKDQGEGALDAVPLTPSDLLYTYSAYVYRVLDGDTIKAVVDLGFGITTTQTLRLRGIDAPEIQTRDGMEAKEFVEKMLAHSPRVLIKTVKSDKYDRYLADVFRADKTGKQVYLNNLLLEQGHAVRVRE